MSTFDDLRAQCLSTGRLFEDKDFPANGQSIYPGENNPEDWLWKRPKDICKDPKLTIDGASRFDLVQGDLGDCWFIAAAAVLATKKELFAKVVPTDQGFGANYSGIFHFNFWCFGEWVEVIIDDRFPVTVDGKLRFGQNRSSPNEFWGPLLEKAYAKLNGSYNAINVGHVRDALVDFTGGITEAFNLRQEERVPPELFDIMATSFKAGSTMGCGIWGDVGVMREELMWNGLFKGHAYSITCVLQARVQGWSVKLLRLRNPWGRIEWTGAWSDGSDEWKDVSSQDKQRIGLTVEDDGEYWISYDDFLTNFHALDIVHLSAATFARVESATEPLVWEETAHHGRWVKGVSAGGSGLLSDNKDLYYTNPQFYMVLKEPDEGDIAGECTCVISLMQKQYRKRKMNPTMKNLVIGFDVHLVKDGKPEVLTSDTVCANTMLKKQFRTRSLLREVSCRLSLSPGVYCIIPNTLKPHQDSEFLFRIYTHRKIASGVLEEKSDTPGATEDNSARPVGSVPSELFCVYAGDDHGIDARDLRDILNELSRKEFGRTTAFGMEACRSLLAMIDKERSGVLNFEETSDLWDEILFWKKIFNRYDRDKSGSIDTYELRKVFKDIGITLGLGAISALATRYGGKDMTMFFEDFALCLARTVSLRVAFKEHCAKDRPDEARLSLDEWLQTMLYL